MKTIAVILSGCGFKDGSEITEAVSTLIALSEAGAHYEIFAPDILAPTVDHISQTTKGEHSVLAESARLARGNIKPLTQLDARRFDGLAMPGGYGAAKVLCDFAEKGAKGTVLPDLKKIILDFNEAEKPIFAACIAPTILALVLGKKHITVTIGNDTETAQEISKTGALHEPCDVEDFVSDRENRIITTPAYMYDAHPHEVFQGIRSAILELVEIA